MDFRAAPEPRADLLDFNSFAGKMFLAPIWETAAGYQFGQVINPVSDAEAYIGELPSPAQATETAGRTPT